MQKEFPELGKKTKLNLEDLRAKVNSRIEEIKVQDAKEKAAPKKALLRKTEAVSVREDEGPIDFRAGLRKTPSRAGKTETEKEVAPTYSRARLRPAGKGLGKKELLRRSVFTLRNEIYEIVNIAYSKYVCDKPDFVKTMDDIKSRTGKKAEQGLMIYTVVEEFYKAREENVHTTEKPSFWANVISPEYVFDHLKDNLIMPRFKGASEDEIREIFLSTD